MTTVAWFNCFAGIAGDMALGALLDAGADIQYVERTLHNLPVGGWELETSAVLRGGIAATHVSVATKDTSVVRTHAHIVGIVEEARLPDRVRDRVLATFAALAEAEGRIHRHPPASVHFHEVGGLDAIVDIVGTCAALESLGVDEIRSSAVATGTGTVRAAHGVLPNPAPAVVELLRGAPTYGRDVAFELATPTGAALVAALGCGWGPMPAMTVAAVGYGAGTRDLQDLPNVTQVVVGEADTAGHQPGQEVLLLETNVDDATGETLAHAVAALLDAGAHDAWVTPIVMKKGRPGHMVSALVDPSLAGQIAEVLRTETGTMGIRGHALDRWPSARVIEEVTVDGLPIRVKVSPGRVKAEHDDASRVARLRGLPLDEVKARAEAAWRGTASARDDADDEGEPPDEPA